VTAVVSSTRDREYRFRHPHQRLGPTRSVPQPIKLSLRIGEEQIFPKR